MQGGRESQTAATFRLWGFELSKSNAAEISECAKSPWICFEMDARRTRKSNRSNLPVVRIWIIEVQRGRRSKQIQGGIAQLARASALQAEGRRFESVYLHKTGVTIFLICDACFVSRLMHCRAHSPYKIYLWNLQKITCIIFLILFGLYLFSHQSCTSSTLLLPKEIYTRK